MPRTSADTVTVACRLPSGLVCAVVDMADYVSQIEKARAGQPVLIKHKGKFRIRGYNEARALDSAGTINMESRNCVGGFGLTHGIPKALWDEWFEQSQDYPPVRNGLIKAFEQPESAISYAKEHAELKTGFDPLDPKDPAPGIKPEQYQGMDQSGKKSERGMPAFTE